MAQSTTVAPGVRPASFRFRCIACGDLSDVASQNFRCSRCGDLLEITYPFSSKLSERPVTLMSADLKSSWKQRRLSASAVDLSGVWRFRQRLPNLENEQHAITLREGNTPLYEMPRC